MRTFLWIGTSLCRASIHIEALGPKSALSSISGALWEKKNLVRYSSLPSLQCSFPSPLLLCPFPSPPLLIPLPLGVPACASCRSGSPGTACSVHANAHLICVTSSSLTYSSISNVVCGLCRSWEKFPTSQCFGSGPELGPFHPLTRWKISAAGWLELVANYSKQRSHSFHLFES